MCPGGNLSPRHSFLCPNGTIFNQKKRICDWWYNVDCRKHSRKIRSPIDTLLIMEEWLTSFIPFFYYNFFVYLTPDISSWFERLYKLIVPLDDDVATELTFYGVDSRSQLWTKCMRALEMETCTIWLQLLAWATCWFEAIGKQPYCTQPLLPTIFYVSLV